MSGHRWKVVSYLSFVSALAAFFCFPGFAKAQATPGTPSWSAYEKHQYDTINLQNLNVMLNVPVMNKSGAFPFKATYSGIPSYVALQGVHDQTLTPGATIPPGTFLLVINGILSPEYGTGYAAPGLTTSGVQCPNGDGSGTATMYSQWSVEDATGTFHYLPNTDASYAGSTCSGGFTDQVTDGTGYTLSVTGAL